MNKLDYIELGGAITAVFLDDKKYQVNKHVPTFEKDGTYVGDFFNFTMCELDGDEPPIFYHVYSPYDIISGSSCQHAAVLRAGKLLFTSEFTPYMLQRTGVMTSLVLRQLGLSDLSDKSVAFLGTGTIARHDLEALKSFYPSLDRISFITPNPQGKNGVAFTELANRLDIVSELSSLEQIGDFDVIICHTSSKTPVLSEDMLSRIKQDAVIASFSSEDFNEVAPAFFNTEIANIIVDWDQTADEATELKTAIDMGLADRTKLISLKSLLLDESLEKKRYTIYRSHGTPMQNLAALKLLRSEV